MLTREDWLNRAADDDERFWLARVWELAERAADEGVPLAGLFADVSRQAKLRKAFPALGKKLGLTLCFWGGFPAAERRVPVVMPTLYEPETEQEGGLADWPEYLGEDPFSYARLYFTRDGGPGHRDILGAALGLGLKRERLGDICFHEEGADLVLLPEACPVVLRDFRQAGRHALRAEKLSGRGAFRGSVPVLEPRKVSVASERLDNVVAALWNLSREKAKEAITGGLVSLDGLPELRPSASVREGQILRCRGLGKARLEAFGGLSRKGRLWCEFNVFS